MSRKGKPSRTDPSADSLLRTFAPIKLLTVQDVAALTSLHQCVVARRVRTGAMLGFHIASLKSVRIPSFVLEDDPFDQDLSTFLIDIEPFCPTHMHELRVGQVASIFRVRPAAIVRWCALGLLPFHLLESGHRRFIERDLVELIPPAERTILLAHWPQDE